MRSSTRCFSGHLLDSSAVVKKIRKRTAEVNPLRSSIPSKLDIAASSTKYNLPSGNSPHHSSAISSQRTVPKAPSASNLSPSHFPISPSNSSPAAKSAIPPQRGFTSSSLSSSMSHLPLSGCNSVLLSSSSSGCSNFSELVSIFKSSAEMLTEIDDSEADKVKKKSEDKIPQENKMAHCSASLPEKKKVQSLVPLMLSSRSFSAAITCPKKFFLLQYRQDLLPRETVGEAARYDDSAAFSELALRWDRLQFGSKAILIDAVDFETAQKQTEKVILDYFAANASLGEQAPTLTLHRPAFAGPCAVMGEGKLRESSASGKEGNQGNLHPSPRSLVMRARPQVVRYRPKDNQWVILLAFSVIDPLSNPLKASQCLQRIHFAMRAFRNWVTQPHIPITIRKRFVAVNSDPEGMKSPTSSSTSTSGEKSEEGAALFSETPLVAPIDVKRSGILHIRQYFPGPISVLDCDPQKLVKFIQRASLEDLLQEDCKAIARGNGNSGILDCSQLNPSIPLHPLISQRYREMIEAAGTGFPGAKARSSRSLKKRDISEKVYFERQQELLSCLLKYYVPEVVRCCEDPAQRRRWISFSCDEDSEERGAQLLPSSVQRGVTRKEKESDELVCSTALPCFSEHLAPHCVKGETCPFFIEGKCLPRKVESPLLEGDNHLFTLPSTSVTKKVGWWTDGLRTIGDVMREHNKGKVKLTAPQLRYAQSVTSGKVGLNPAAIDAFFQQIRYPLFILDFEATAYAVPPYRKAVAYQSIPFQFSLDVFQNDILTETPKHYDFLHFGKGYSPNQDPRRACINELMRIVKVEREKKRLELLSSTSSSPPEIPVKEEPVRRGRGRPSKFSTSSARSSQNFFAGGDSSSLSSYDGCFLAHFAAFEKSCLEKLGQLEEMYKEDIKCFHFLDTLELFKKGFVHPNAHGSNSLKKILPAVCPSFQYGVFGGENSEKGENSNKVSAAAPPSASKQDEQQGENVMGLYRMWHHHEGGDSIRELLKRSSTWNSRLPSNLSPKAREKIWTVLRIQLLEYCSLDTKAIYELMREIWRMRQEVQRLSEKESQQNDDGNDPSSCTSMTPDKSGWVWISPKEWDVVY